MPFCRSQTASIFGLKRPHSAEKRNIKYTLGPATVSSDGSASTAERVAIVRCSHALPQGAPGQPAGGTQHKVVIAGYLYAAYLIADSLEGALAHPLGPLAVFCQLRFKLSLLSPKPAAGVFGFADVREPKAKSAGKTSVATAPI